MKLTPKQDLGFAAILLLLGFAAMQGLFLFIDPPQSVFYEYEQSLHDDIVTEILREIESEEDRESAEKPASAGEGLEAAWTPSKDSPIALLSMEEALKYRPTLQSLQQWVESVPELQDIDPASVEWNEEMAYLWTICKEHQAFQAFVMQHADRSRTRWADLEHSVSLETELMPASEYIYKHISPESELWALIIGYSNEVADLIRNAGENADHKDVEPSKWALHSALAEAGSPSYEALLSLLRE